MLLLAAEQAMNVNITHVNGWSVWWFTGFFSVWSYIILNQIIVSKDHLSSIKKHLAYTNYREYDVREDL